MESNKLIFSFVDNTSGFEANPDKVRLTDLARFTTDITIFLRGDGKEIDPKLIDVAIKKGSLQLVTSPIDNAPNFFNDLRRLSTTELLDSIDPKRKEIIEEWQKQTRNFPGISYHIHSKYLDKSIQINSDTDFHSDDADQWVRVERYIRGEIQDLGGAKNPNIHIKYSDGKTLTVKADRDALRNDSINRLYKPAMLRINAEYNVSTREIRNATLLDFLDYSPSFKEDDLIKLTRRGEIAWSDISNPTAWVEDIRGGLH